MKAKAETVKVAVRVRPMNKREEAENSEICVEVDSSTNQISVTSKKVDTKTFQFDYVYPMTSTQREVYDQVAFPIVESIFQGYNGTVFAYGQTGCGKTFTMMGVVSDPTLRGVIPNAFEHIFGYIQSESDKTFLVRCSFVEIYNEEVRDLLGKNKNVALEVREDPKKGTFVKDLSYTPLKNTDEIVRCLDKGNANRHVGATSMNDKSSRSHSLFTVYIEIQEGEGKNQKIRTGKLNLVDLAGSERVGKTNATGQTFDEGKKINLSLTALGSVIDALSSNRKHIPYKDSKLTRLLADSLGGNTKTVMFANVSPASFNYDETVGTLRYASRAKLIKNAPKINEDPKDALLRQYEEQIKLLKAQLDGKEPMQTQIVEKIVEVPVQSERSNQQAEYHRSNSSEEEKQKLLARIAELEKEMIGGGNVKGSGNFDLVDETEKFKEYRKQRMKEVEEMENKMIKLEQEKRAEEEALQNNVQKLRKKIIILKNEIIDLKYDNEKDRIDFFENIKDLNKENKFYEGIIKYLLSDKELERIKHKAKYDEDNQKWKIQPFCFKDKILMFPAIKDGQIPDLIEKEHKKREIIFAKPKSTEDSHPQPQITTKPKKKIKLLVNNELQSVPEIPKEQEMENEFDNNIVDIEHKRITAPVFNNALFDVDNEFNGPSGFNNTSFKGNTKIKIKNDKLKLLDNDPITNKLNQFKHSSPLGSGYSGNYHLMTPEEKRRYEELEKYREQKMIPETILSKKSKALEPMSALSHCKITITDNQKIPSISRDKIPFHKSRLPELNNNIIK